MTKKLLKTLFLGMSLMSINSNANAASIVPLEQAGETRSDASDAGNVIFDTFKEAFGDKIAALAASATTNSKYYQAVASDKSTDQYTLLLTINAQGSGYIKDSNSTASAAISPYATVVGGLDSLTAPTKMTNPSSIVYEFTEDADVAAPLRKTKIALVVDHPPVLSGLDETDKSPKKLTRTNMECYIDTNIGTSGRTFSGQAIVSKDLQLAIDKFLAGSSGSTTIHSCKSASISIGSAVTGLAKGTEVSWTASAAADKAPAITVIITPDN